MRLAFRSLMVLVLLTVVLSLTGCAPKAQGPATVKVLTMQQAGATPEEMNTIVDRFNKSNPNVKVEIEYVSYDALHDKIVTAMATNPPSYDVILVDDIWYAEFAKNGYILDVTSRVDATTKTNIFPAAWDITSVGGKIYGLPWLLDQKYFYYNAKLLQDAGIANPPKTWEELVEQGKILKDKKLVEYPIVWSWGQMEAVICDWVTLLYGNGGKLVDDAGKPAFNDAKGVATLEWMVKSIEDGTSNPASISYGEEDVRNVFSQGKAAFASNWVYMYEMADLNPKESQINGQVKMALMPVFSGGPESSTINGSMGFSVVAKSKSADAAWEYIKFLTSEPIQKEFSAHVLPVWSTQYDGEALTALTKLNQSNPVTVPAFKAQFPTAHVRPKVPYYLEGSKALQLAIQEALTKSKTPKQALDDAAAKWVELAK